MTLTPEVAKYREGYQDALEDVRVAYVDQGLEGVLFWLAAGLTNPVARQKALRLYEEFKERTTVVFDPDETAPMDVVDKP